MDIYPQKKEVEVERKVIKNESGASSALLSWNVTQFKNVIRNQKWYVAFFIFIALLLAYGLFSDNFLLGILAILTALMFYLFEKREPQAFNFKITLEGIFAQDRIYEFSSLESFWIFYEPQGRKELSLKSKKGFIPYIHIPLGDADPTKIRSLLVDFIPEIEQDENFIDSVNQIV